MAWASIDAWSAEALISAEVRRRWPSGSASRLVHACPRCGSSEHGRPIVTRAEGISPYVSVSRAAGLVVVALTRTGPVGVDVEAAAPTSFVGFDGVALHPAETAASLEDRATTWVRKESLLKAVGLGLAVDPRLVHLSPCDLPPELLAWDAEDPPVQPVWMFDVPMSAGLVAAVTVLSQVRPRLTIRQAVPAAPCRPATP